ncbi:MAG: alpha/beta family hydrolase [Acidobacteriaceae bacterium]
MYGIREIIEPSPDGISVRGFLHLPEMANGNGLALTHSAGANCQSPLLVSVARAFCETGFTVLRFDLPFRQLRPHGPPLRGSAERDQLGIRRAIEVLRKRVPERVFAGGHSYGGRQVTMLTASDEPPQLDGLLLFSYPLRPPKRPEQLRTAHFPRLRTPALFVHGTKDGFGTIDEMTRALKLIPAPTRLLSVLGAGHEILSKRNVDELPKQVVDVLSAFYSVSR